MAKAATCLPDAALYLRYGTTPVPKPHWRSWVLYICCRPPAGPGSGDRGRITFYLSPSAPPPIDRAPLPPPSDLTTIACTPASALVPSASEVTEPSEATRSTPGHAEILTQPFREAAKANVEETAYTMARGPDTDLFSADDAPESPDLRTHVDKLDSDPEAPRTPDVLHPVRSNPPQQYACVRPLIGTRPRFMYEDEYGPTSPLSASFRRPKMRLLPSTYFSIGHPIPLWEQETHQQSATRLFLGRRPFDETQGFLEALVATHTPTGRGERITTDGDVEQNPGPSAPSSCPQTALMQAWGGSLELQAAFFHTDTVLAAPGPSGSQRRFQRYYIFMCAFCCTSVHAFCDTLPLVTHLALCQNRGSLGYGIVEDNRPPPDEHGLSGRGEDLLSNGDVEANPGPKGTEPRTRRRRESAMDMDGDPAASSSSSPHVSHVFVGPEDNNAPLRVGGIRPNPYGTNHRPAFRSC